MCGLSRAEQRAGQGAPRRALQHRLAPGPAPVAVHDPGAVVLGAGGQHGGDGRHGRAQPGVRRTRVRSMSSTVAAPQRCHGAPQLRLVPAQQSRPRRRRRRWPAPTATGARPGSPCAPSASALTTSGARRSAAVDVDLGPPGDRVDDLGQDVGRGRRVGQLAGAVVGHHDGGRPGLDAAHGVVGPLHALDHDGQLAQPGQPPDVVGRERRLELVRDHGHEPTLARAVGAVARQVGQGQVVGQVHADAPLAQAEARDGSVDGQDQGAVAVRGGPAHQLLGARPLPQDVDLHPAGRVRRGGGHVLERAGGQRRQDQQRPGRGGAPGAWPPRPRRGPAPGSPSGRWRRAS